MNHSPENHSPENHSPERSTNQSPVNINTSDTPTQSFGSVVKAHYQGSLIDIVNNGHNIDGEFGNQENYVTYGGEQYYLQGFHFHTQSEHTFNGKNTDGEIHLVHQSATGKTLVVGIPIDGVAPDSSAARAINPQLDAFLGALNGTIKDTPINGFSFDPSQLISRKTRVYNYGGSLTTSPYTDATWVLAAKPLSVNENDRRCCTNSMS